MLCRIIRTGEEMSDYHPFHRGDKVVIRKDGSLHVVAHVYKPSGRLLMTDFTQADSKDVAMVEKKPLYGIMSLATNSPHFVAEEDLFDYLPPEIEQEGLF
jgi:hypothetical protein